MELFNQMAAVAAVLGSLGGLAWWLRRRGPLERPSFRRSAGRRLESLERLPLGPQQTLHLVRVGSRALLLAATPNGCALLDSVDVRALDPSPEAIQ
ncbi:MAG TPA: flagellar biosynthetic protein FliO [Bryobacteraceae bacterium]|nr:flagellar biosynthetic protein FliO [Bryobacteraceae bacterium]